MKFSPDSVRAQREDMLLRLLIRATHTMNATMAERVRARGYPDFQPSFTALLGHLDTEGTRIGTLARRMGTSRQAASQLLSEIEARGYVERCPDPADRRGVIARHTTRGRQILLAAIEVMLGIETEYTSILGGQGMSRLKGGLRQLLAGIDPSGDLRPE